MGSFAWPYDASVLLCFCGATQDATQRGEAGPVRLWTLHPKYLDAQGLVSVWREALLARQVLRGRTKGYRNHPQLERFRSHPAPVSAINAYLAAVYEEAVARGYAFDKAKLGAVRNGARIRVTDRQLDYE